MNNIEKNKMVLELRNMAGKRLCISGIRSNRELREHLLEMIPEGETRFLLFETDDIADIKVHTTFEPIYSTVNSDCSDIQEAKSIPVGQLDRMGEMYKVQQLGEAIGYGNLMEWASALWRRHLRERGFHPSGAFIPKCAEAGPQQLIYDQYVNLFKGDFFDVTIGGKGFNLGDRVKINKAYSILHYKHGMKGDLIKDMEGITGTIIARDSFDSYTVCSMKVDPQWEKHYKNGMTRLNVDDEVELLPHEEERSKED